VIECCLLRAFWGNVHACMGNSLYRDSNGDGWNRNVDQVVAFKMRHGRDPQTGDLDCPLHLWLNQMRRCYKTNRMTKEHMKVFLDKGLLEPVLILCNVEKWDENLAAAMQLTEKEGRNPAEDEMHLHCWFKDIRLMYKSGTMLEHRQEPC